MSPWLIHFSIYTIIRPRPTYLLVAILCFLAISGIYLFCDYWNAILGETFFFVGEISLYQIGFSLILVFIVFLTVRKNKKKNCLELIKMCRHLCVLAVFLTILIVIVLPDGITFASFKITPGRLQILLLVLPYTTFLTAKYNRITFTTSVSVFFFLWIIPILVGFSAIGIIPLLEIYAFYLLGIIMYLTHKHRFPIGGCLLILSVFIAIFISIFSVGSSHLMRVKDASEIRLFVRNTPLLGETPGFIDSLPLSVQYALYSLHNVPLMVLLGYGWLPFVMIVVSEFGVIIGLLFWGKQARSSFGQFTCCFTSILFISRTLLYVITSFWYPITVFLPLQGDIFSVSVDLFFVVFARVVSNIDFTPSLIDLDASDQTSLFEVLEMLIKALSIVLAKMKKALFRHIYHGIELVSREVEAENNMMAKSSDSNKLHIDHKYNNKPIKNITEERIMPTSVFVTYAWKPKEPEVVKYAKEVQAFVNTLRANGFDATFDLALFEEYDNWHKVMVAGLKMDKSSPNLCVNCFRHNMQEAA